MDFTSWILKRQNLIPQADRLTLLINSAGAAGIAEPELRGRVDLPKKIVDDLLQALIQAGQVAVFERGGKRVFAAGI